jgi:hypothetical protein
MIRSTYLHSPEFATKKRSGSFGVISCIRKIVDEPIVSVMMMTVMGQRGGSQRDCFPLRESESSALPSSLIGCSLASLERLATREGAAYTGADVPISISTSFAGDTDSPFLLAAPCRACAALVWRVNIVSMPSLRFCTGPLCRPLWAWRSYSEPTNPPRMSICI